MLPGTKVNVFNGMWEIVTLLREGDERGKSSLLKELRFNLKLTAYLFHLIITMSKTNSREKWEIANKTKSTFSNNKNER